MSGDLNDLLHHHLHLLRDHSPVFTRGEFTRSARVVTNRFMSADAIFTTNAPGKNASRARITIRVEKISRFIFPQMESATPSVAITRRAVRPTQAIP
jgi:hypothetical protein